MAQGIEPLNTRGDLGYRLCGNSFYSHDSYTF